MARSASAIRLRDPKLEKLDGDALDQHTIEPALAGVDAVIQTLGVSPTPELILGGTRLFSVATRVLVNAMEASAVRRLICVTGFGAGDSRGRGGTPCMGLFLSRSFSRAAHLSSFVSSLFDMKARFFASDPKPSRAGEPSRLIASSATTRRAWR